MYYKLKDDVRLRSYDRLPRLVLKDGIPMGVRDAEFQALDLCDGTIDLDFPLIPQEVRDAVPDLVERGLVESCEKGTAIRPDQALHRYPNRYLRGVQWSITGGCNYRCRHCFMEAPHAKHADLPTTRLLEICDQLAGAGVSDVQLTGGEPLIRRDFLQIVRRILDDGMDLSQIYTNGLLVTEGLLDALSEMGARPQFCISFDGVGHHDWLRGVEGAEAAAERALRLCHERGFPTHASMTLHSGNVDSLLETCETLAEWGVDSMKVGPLEAMGEWVRGGLGEPISLEDRLRAYLDFVPRYVEAGMPLPSLQMEALVSIVRPEVARREERRAEVRRALWESMAGEGPTADAETTRGPVRVIARTRCKDADTTCLCLSTRLNGYISSEGRMLPCMTMSDVEGPVTSGFPTLADATVSQVLTDSTLIEATDTRLRDLIAANAECAGCEHVMDCLGGCRAVALRANPDTYFGIDRDRCALFKGGWIERFEAMAEAVNDRQTKGGTAV